ncbi:Signal transduction histidine kinase [Caenispirillum bisanense]|uniref:Sensory/regulatory protein RpfC n=1 Tax=Caenispirillum bisanense TaxID=414052 RepID=A0A286GWJ8_9PROT|nr:Signal transduction histidine kinase [Caenispirillum bisanense]
MLGHSTTLAVVAAIFIVLTYGLTVWVAGRILTDGIVQATGNANHTALGVIANERGDDLRALIAGLAAVPPEEVAGSPEFGAMDFLMRHATQGTDIVALKVFSPDGLTLYATDRGRAGGDGSGSALFQAAAAGDVVSALNRAAGGGWLVSTYAPLPGATGGVAAVLEIYADRTAAVEEARSAVRRLVLATGPVVVVATGLVIGLVLGAARRQGRQTRALADLAAENMRAREAAENADRAKTRFLANVSHELRTPMNGIIGMCYLAQRTNPTPAQRDYLGKINESAQSLLRTLNGILDFSRIEDGALRIVAAAMDPRAVAEDAVAAVRAGARAKGLTVVLVCPTPLPTAVLGDADQVRQILLKLLGNAVKFTERGSVALTVTAPEPPPAPGRVRLRFEVSDTGIGMDAETLACLFGGARQGDDSRTRRYGGLGLGLALADRLAALMGGGIAVESTPGRGSRFIVDLPFELTEADALLGPAASPEADRAPASPEPAAGAAAPPSPPPAPVAAAARAGGRRVLLVEDNAVNRAVIAGYMGDGPDDLVAVDGGHAALALLQAPGAFFDAIFMDLQMPGMDGLEATRRIRALADWQSVPIIALTAHTSPEDRQRCLAAGMNDHLGKPVRLNDLSDCLDRWCGPVAAAGPAPLPPELAARVRPLLVTLASLVGGGDVAASATAGEIAEALAGTALAEAGARLLALVDDFDFDAAAAAVVDLARHCDAACPPADGPSTEFVKP